MALSNLKSSAKSRQGKTQFPSSRGTARRRVRSFSTATRRKKEKKAADGGEGVKGNTGGGGGEEAEGEQGEGGKAGAAGGGSRQSSSCADVTNQYNLVVVSEKEVEPEHFTISSTGIVHIQPGRPSEYTTLSDFSRQAFAFSVLRSMIFFKTFLLKKLMTLWRNNVRKLMYKRQRLRLGRKLFLAKPVYVEHLMNILKIFADLRDVALIHIPPQGTLYDLSTFSALQTSTRIDVKQGASHFIEVRRRRRRGKNRDTTTKGRTGGGENKQKKKKKKRGRKTPSPSIEGRTECCFCLTLSSVGPHGLLGRAEKKATKERRG